jgi:hypothetical protein
MSCKLHIERESSADRRRKFNSAAYVELTSGAGMNWSGSQGPAVIIPTHQASKQAAGFNLSGRVIRIASEELDACCSASYQ